MTRGQRFQPYKLPVAAIASGIISFSQFEPIPIADCTTLTHSQGFEASDLEKFHHREEDLQVQPRGPSAMQSQSMADSNDENIIADDELEKRVCMATRREESPEIAIGSERSSVVGSNHSEEKTLLTEPIQTHMGGFKLMMFNRLATQAHLNEEHLALGRQMCNIDNADQFVACVISTLAVRQEVVLLRRDISRQLGEIRTACVSKSDNDVWKANEELKAYLRSVATQRIMDGDLQGYTATEEKSNNGVKHKLAFSLYAKVLSAVLSNPDQWKRRCLPPGYGTDPDPRSTKALQTAINNVLKEIRKEFDGVLLSNINLPNRSAEQVNANVPKIDGVILKLWEKKHTQVGGCILVEDEILDAVDHLQEARYAWLRMQAIHWGLNIGVYKKQTLWNVVDRKLEYLRGQTLRYRYAFYIVAVNDDIDRIDGSKNFEELKAITNFAPPDEAQIQTVMKELDETYRESTGADEASHEQTLAPCD
ncbi:hypothetical protein DFH28DRAFT_1146817 [Melampsora americana]|nr:hypothetical protein DFH28DRAFT_1146817 [Melampsora americana]